MNRLRASSAFSTLSQNGPLAGARRQAAAWWAERTSRERSVLRIGAAFLALVLFWSLGLKPALDSIAHSRERLPRLRAEAAQIDALILEAQSLQRRASGQVAAGALPEALRTTLRRSGLEATATLASAEAVAGTPPSMWEIALEDANAAHVMEWLAALPHLLHVRIHTVELFRSRLNGRDRPGQVTGRILLHGPKEAGT